MKLRISDWIHYFVLTWCCVSINCLKVVTFKVAKLAKNRVFHASIWCKSNGEKGMIWLEFFLCFTRCEHCFQLVSMDVIFNSTLHSQWLCVLWRMIVCFPPPFIHQIWPGVTIKSIPIKKCRPRLTSPSNKKHWALSKLII